MFTKLKYKFSYSYHFYLLIVTFILLISSSKIYPQSGWNFNNPYPTGFTLWDITKDNSGRIWIVGSYGTVFNASVGGEWNKVELEPNTHFTGITFQRENGWIIGTDGIIYQSVDGGQNWQLINSGTLKTLKQVQFLDMNVGWIMGEDSLLLHTTDGGNNWNTDTLDYGLHTNAYAWPWNQILFQDEEVGWLLVGYYSPGNLDIDPESKGAFLKTTNGGKSWAILDSGDTKYGSIYFLNDSIGWLTTKSVNDGTRFLHTNDGGKNWIFLSYSADWREIVFIDEQVGLGLIAGYIGKTTDGGVTWVYDEYLEPPGPGDGIKRIIMENETEGWCVGSTGFVLKTNDGGNSWKHIDKRLDIYYGALNDVVFTGQNEGWIVGNQLLDFPLDTTIILHTTNGGDSWIRKQINIDEGLNRIIALNNQELWTFSTSMLLKSTDGGQNWIVNNLHPPSDIFRDMFFHDKLNFIVIAGKKIFRTDDGGESWTTQGDFNALYLKRILFTDQLNGWLIGRTSSTGTPNFRTTDGGVMWFEVQSNFTAIYFVDAIVGYAIEEGNVHKTTNGGNSWWQISENPNSFANWTTNLSFVDEANGWTWDVFDIYNTSDSGRTWIKSNGITKIADLFGGGLYMVSNRLGWAVGRNGSIYKYTADSVSTIEYEDLVYPKNYLLIQNYPNPFNPTTKIQFTIPVGTRHAVSVQLRVYDVLGNEIATLVNEEKPAGNYEAEFDGTGLSSGIYFYRLQAGDYVETKKMVLIR